MKLDKLTRLSEPALKEVRAFKELHNIKTDREALEKLILEAAHTRMYLQYTLTHSDATKEDPECLRRLIYLGDFYCAKNAPRIVQLPTLDICKACKMKVIIWRKEEKQPLISNAEPDRIPVKQVYCDRETLNVVRSACDRCADPCEKRALFYPLTERNI